MNAKTFLQFYFPSALGFVVLRESKNFLDKKFLLSRRTKNSCSPEGQQSPKPKENKIAKKFLHSRSNPSFHNLAANKQHIFYFFALILFLRVRFFLFRKPSCVYYFVNWWANLLTDGWNYFPKAANLLIINQLFVYAIH